MLTTPLTFNASKELKCEECGLTFDNGTNYDRFSILIMGKTLPAIALTGGLLNVLVVLVFSMKKPRTSASTYLAALGFSDALLTLSAIFVFSFLRFKSTVQWIGSIYFTLVREVFTLAMTVQWTSVYITLVAAFDCFISICVKKKRKAFCRVHVAKRALGLVLILSISYNFVHYFEMTVEHCWWPGAVSHLTTVCATPLRKNPVFNFWYYTFGYTLLMSTGPLVVLLGLCTAICVKLKNARNRVSRSPAPQGLGYALNERHTMLCRRSSSINSLEEATMLIMVVILFIMCNIPALLLNVIEFLQVNTQYMSFFVDISNLLVVVNSTMNFFIYVAVGSQFRKSLRKLFCREKSTVQNILLSNSGLPSEDISLAIMLVSKSNK